MTQEAQPPSQAIAIKCSICDNGTLSQKPYALIESVPYHECEACKSIYVPDPILIKEDKKQIYDDNYWLSEIESSRSRSYGSTLARIAETFLYARIPIDKFIDIGCGPGLTLDALAVLAPKFRHIFYGCELYPPPIEYRCKADNYMHCSVSECEHLFAAGICIEVIEHMWPHQLKQLAEDISKSSQPGAIYYFNSAQPIHVMNHDPGYLDPYRRGHIASYSLQGLQEIFSKHGFTVLPLHGREWGFLVEYKSVSNSDITASELLERIWTPVDKNVEVLASNGFGPLMHTIGIESARCYLESAISMERALWAQQLDHTVKKLRNNATGNCQES